jgi:hypothetical protein
MSMLPNLETGESGTAWQQLNKIINELEVAYLETDSPGMAIGFRRIRALINKRLAHYQTQDEVMKTVEQRRRLVETEQRIALQGERAITVDQLFWLMGAIISIIDTVVNSQDERIEVGNRIQQLVTIGNS